VQAPAPAPAPGLVPAPAPKSPAAPKAAARPQKTATPPPLPAQPLTPAPAQLGGARPLEIPVRIPLDGRVVVTEANGVPITATFTNEKAGKSDRTLTVTVPQSERERVIVVAWMKSASPAPLP